MTSISNIVRNSSKQLLSWVEGGTPYHVKWHANAKPDVVWATNSQLNNGLLRFVYDTQGNLLTVSNLGLQSPFIDELTEAANGGETVGGEVVRQPSLCSSKLTTKDGRLFMGGEHVRHIGINAVDMFLDFLVPFTVTGVSKLSVGVVSTSAAHGLAIGEPVYIANLGGMTQLSGYYFVNTVPSSMSITLKDAAGVPVNTTNFTTYTSGGTVQRAWFYTDIPLIAASMIKLIRCSLGHPGTAAIWAATIGTNGAVPNANLATSLRIFLDYCWLHQVGVELTLFWTYTTIPAVLSTNVTAYQTPGSTTRAYCTNLAGYIAKNFHKHPGLAAYNIGTEWFDIASVAQFATTDTQIGVNHMQFLRDVCNEIVAAIRVWDFDRTIIAPHGGNGFYEGGKIEDFLTKFIYSAGDCDAISYHFYPNTNRANFSRAFVGDDLGGADILLPALRAACFKAGKVCIIDEFGADDDATVYSGQPVGAISARSWNKAIDAGFELMLDWSWYVTGAIGGGGASDIKTIRRDVMALIAAKNAALTPGFVVLPDIYGKRERSTLPTKLARGTGATGSHIAIPASPDLSVGTAVGARMAWMWWMRKQSAFGTGPILFACDNGTAGFRLNLNADEGLKFYLLLNGSYVSFDPGAFTYPNNDADTTKMYAGNLHHVAVYWDGTVDGRTGADGNQHATIWIDGVMVARVTKSGAVGVGATDRGLFLLSNSDGSGNNAPMDIGDFMLGKDFVLTSQMVADYLRHGVVPTGMQHRYKLAEDARDSIGSLHGTAYNITYVNKFR